MAILSCKIMHFILGQSISILFKFRISSFVWPHFFDAISGCLVELEMCSSYAFQNKVIA